MLNIQKRQYSGFSRFHFKPKLWPTLATLLLLPLLLWLGFWQLDRAQQKQTLQDEFMVQSQRPTVDIERLTLGSAASRYRRVIAIGEYDQAQQILMDNQVRNGQVGYYVYTPLKLMRAKRAVLVNRGWIAVGESRQRLPDLRLVQTAITVQGRLSQPVNPGLLLDEPDDQPWPLVVQHISYERLSQRLGYALEPAVILLDADDPQGYVRDWRPQFGGLGPQRHQGYAVQWFALALTLVVIYIAVNLTRIESTS